MNKRVAILQSNYIPWKGYFDIIASVDEFIIYDEMQYTRRDWRNRNQIKTPQGSLWLTIPVEVKGRYFQKIQDTKISGNSWALNHWKTLEQNYKSAKYFSDIEPWLKPLYLEHSYQTISELNICFIKEICNFLGISTMISQSKDFNLVGDKNERLVDLCRQLKANIYLSGPSARGYIDEGLFLDAGINVEWSDYSNYLEYTQLWGEFSHNFSILDLLFNCGKYSRSYMKY